MLGDCWLIGLQRTDDPARPYWMMVDCGAVLGTSDAAEHMQSIVQDIAATTNGTIDLVIATHEHWDHLSGFVQAKDRIAELTFNAVWLAWTENPDDEQARRLADERANALAALQIAQARLRIAGDGDAADDVDVVLSSFFGVGSGSSTAAAMQAVRSLAPDHLSYCEPGQPPWSPPGTTARLYVLGPPRDEKLLKKYAISPTSPEVYGIERTSQYMQYVASALGSEVPEPPFDVMQVIPMAVAEGMTFFKEWYWGSDVDPSNGGAPWRRIDGAWLQSSPELALQLDSATNNTSLVIAIKLDGGDVLLLPGDAQIGSWDSWQTLRFDDGTTGPALLERCVFYKVGHHGSHNATLRENGLEKMKRLQTAMVPVDHAMAVKKHWDRIPLPALLTALDSKTDHNVIRADRDATAARPVRAADNGLWYEITL
jgi:hypothetical protein